MASRKDLCGLLSVPYDKDDPSPCEGCRTLTDWSKRQVEKFKKGGPYEPWKGQEIALCKNCHKPIYYSAVDTVWIHNDTLQYFCDGQYGKEGPQHAEREL